MFGLMKSRGIIAARSCIHTYVIRCVHNLEGVSTLRPQMTSASEDPRIFWFYRSRSALGHPGIKSLVGLTPISHSRIWNSTTF